jgi:hypothetical protein
MKTKKDTGLIAFRYATWSFATPFFDAAQRLVVEESVLARRAIEKGLAEAAMEIAHERKQAKDAEAKIKGLKLNPKWPLTPQVTMSYAGT